MKTKSKQSTKPSKAAVEKAAAPVIKHLIGSGMRSMTDTRGLFDEKYMMRMVDQLVARFEANNDGSKQAVFDLAVAQLVRARIVRVVRSTY